MAQDDALQQRLPPNDREAERAVLGCMLRDNSTVADVVQIIRGASFYQYAHRVLFEAIVELVVNDNVPADPVTLFDYLHATDQTNDIGGAAYIVEIWDAAPSLSNFEQYAQVVRGMAIKRALVHVGNEISKIAMEGGEWKEQLDECERKLGAISGKVRSSQIQHFSAAVRESIDRMGERSTNPERQGIVTGWPTLDKTLGCMDPGDLVVVAARPSVGKTAFMMNLACLLSTNGSPVFVSSMEQAAVELADRTLAAYAPLNLGMIRDGRIVGHEEKLLNASSKVSKLPITFDHNPQQSVLDIIASMRRSQKNGVKVAMIDYLQLIVPDDTRANRQEQVAGITRKIKIASRQTGLITVLLAQLNRESDKRADGRPKLSDLRESGAIEQDADVVMLLHTDSEESLQLEVIVAKNRKGKKGSAMLGFDKSTSRIMEWESADRL